ncbi:MAG: hypothetical protein ABI596_08620 [Pyrinomonadaceae bacterium]
MRLNFSNHVTKPPGHFPKGLEAVVKPGTEFGVVLNQSISRPAANVR